MLGMVVTMVTVLWWSWWQWWRRWRLGRRCDDDGDGGFFVWNSL